MLAAPDRGSSLIVGDKSHQMKYERGNLSTIANVLPIVLKNAPDGTIPLDLIESYL
jgi:threonine aldolase